MELYWQKIAIYFLILIMAFITIDLILPIILEAAKNLTNDKSLIKLFILTVLFLIILLLNPMDILSKNPTLNNLFNLYKDDQDDQAAR